MLDNDIIPSYGTMPEEDFLHNHKGAGTPEELSENLYTENDIDRLNDALESYDRQQAERRREDDFTAL